MSSEGVSKNLNRKKYVQRSTIITQSTNDLTQYKVVEILVI